MPVWNPPVPFLAEAIASVRAQATPTGSCASSTTRRPSPTCAQCLEREAAAEPRIRARAPRGQRRHRAGHQRCAGDRARRVLRVPRSRRHARARRAAVHGRGDGARARTRRCSSPTRTSSTRPGSARMPFFKPAWDGEWIRTTNCVLHFMVVRTETLRALGGLARGIDGAQDWDLVLRVAESAGRERIRHVPHVLYHWRELPGSTAAAAFEKPALVDGAAAGDRANRCGGAARRASLRCEHGGLAHRLRAARPAAARVDRDPDARPRRAAARVHRIDRGAHRLSGATRSCWSTTIRATRGPWPISTELARTGAARVVPYPHPFNYAAQCNLGVREARGTMIALVNNDIEVVHAGLARRARQPRRAAGRRARRRHAVLSRRHAAARGRVLGLERRRRPAVDRDAPRLRRAVRPRARRARGERA